LGFSLETLSCRKPILRHISILELCDLFAKKKRRTLRKVELNSWPAALRFAIALTAKLVDVLF
jgi:hypothetical protein